MALVLQLASGDDFYVGDERYFITEIESDTAFAIERERDGRKFLLVDGNPLLIEPEVYASVGTRGQPNLANLCISAPRSIEVDRGDIYRLKRGPEALE